MSYDVDADASGSRARHAFRETSDQLSWLVVALWCPNGIKVVPRGLTGSPWGRDANGALPRHYQM